MPCSDCMHTGEQKPTVLPEAASAGVPGRDSETIHRPNTQRAM